MTIAAIVAASPSRTGNRSRTTTDGARRQASDAAAIATPVTNGRIALAVSRGT